MRRHLFEMVQTDDLFDFVGDDDDDAETILSSNLTQRSRVSLNSLTKSISLENIYNIVISENILDRIVFNRLKFLNLYGVIPGIDETTFKSFKYLMRLQIQTHNMREFWHHSADHKWLMHLNEQNRHNFSIQNNESDLLNEEILAYFKNHYLIFNLNVNGH